MTITAKLRPFLVPVSLLLFSFVPSIFGFVRLIDLATNGRTAENARFHDALVPVVIHCLCGACFFMLGSFQFGSRFRQQFPKWHRTAGVIALPSGALMAASGIWMTAAFGPKPGEDILYLTRFGIGGFIVLFVGLSVVNLVRRRFAQHGAFAMRAFALGAGAGTQTVLFLPYLGLGGEATPPAIVTVHLVAWVLNALFVEALFFRRARSRTPTWQSRRGFSHPISPSN